MDRYDDLDLDLECEEGGVAQKAALFGGMFKKSTKSPESSGQAQATLSLHKAELSASNDSLNSKSTKDKSGKSKRSPRPGHVRRPSQDLLDVKGSNDNFSENTKESGGIFSGMFKKSPKPFGAKTQSQEDLSAPSEPSGSNDNLSVNSSTKESGGMFSGIFKKQQKSRAQSQEDLSAPSELSDNTDNISSNTKESGGMFSGMFKKPHKHLGARTQSQEDLSAPSELSGSTDDLSMHSNTKESGGVFRGIFKKPQKRLGVGTQSQEDLSAPSELSGSSDNLSVNSNTKESGGIFSGMFKKSPKPYGAKAQSQEDLSAAGELSRSTDNLSENHSKEKGGYFSGVFRKKAARSQSQEDLSMDGEKTDNSEDSNENSSTAEKPKAKRNGFSAMMKSTFHIEKKEKSSHTDDELSDDENRSPKKQNKVAGAMTKLNPFKGANKHEKQTSSDEEDSSSEKSSGHKQNAMVGAMTKLNPFRSANKKDPDDAETPKENDKEVKEKPKPPVKSNMIQPEKKERSETPRVPPRRIEKEMKGMSTDDNRPRRTHYDKDNKDVSPREKPGDTSAEIPAVLPRRSKENHSEDKDSEEFESAKDGEERKLLESKTIKMKKQRPNPFMPRTADKAASDDEGLKEDDSSSKEESKEEEGQEKREKPKVKKTKKHNPFLPRVKVKGPPKNAQDGAGENGGANRSLFEQLEEYRIDPADPENAEGDSNVDGLMDWWNTVEPWEDTQQDEDMTEKEEAKAFAVTAEKVQKGIRVFNKLFSERAESLWQHVIDLNGIADGLDKFNKNTKIAQITGGSTSAIGGVATITGLALAPVTMGTSLIVTAVGLGIATAGGLTSAGAGISNQVNNSMDRKKVEKIVEDYQEKITDLNKCLKFIKQGIENLRRFDLIKMKNHAYNRDFPALTSSFYEDGAMAGKAILINANEIMRVVQIANVAGSTAARAVQIASMATGVLTGLFVGMDIYFVAKDSKILKKGAKSEFAAKIREVATQLHDGLVELNTIREELQATEPENKEGKETEALNSEKKEKDDKHDSSEEDEIDRIKKAIKKDYENREYV